MRKGVPFRTSHEVVGRVVRRAEELGCSIAALSPEALAEEHEAFGSDVGKVFDPARSADARAGSGGTGRVDFERVDDYGKAVAEQLELARRELARGL